jgi:hypothetical protein
VSALARVDAALRPAAPAERLAVLRALIGAFGLVYVVARAGHLASVTRLPASQWKPVGPAQILAVPLPAAAVHVLIALAVASGIAFVLGYRFKLSGPLFAALLLWVTSYRNSWGMVFHTENLLALHLVVVGLAPAADALSLDTRRAALRKLAATAESTAAPAATGDGLAPDPRYGGPIRLLTVLTVLTYVIAGITKLRNAGGGWVSGDVLRFYVAYDNVRKIELGDAHSPLGAALVRTGWLWRPLALASLVVELGAPLALLHARVARVWVLAAWLFHVGVLALMAIFFPYPVIGVAFAPFFAVERAAARVLRRARTW